MRSPALKLSWICAAAALVLPWFVFDETFAGTRTRESWGLLWASNCSDFVREFGCRYEFVERGVEWLVIPLHVISRGFALLGVIALLALGAGVLPQRWSTHLGSAALVLFAIHIASVPGDMQYREHGLWFGALLAMVAAVAAVLHQADWRARLRPTALALMVLGSALWFPWIVEREALFPSNPDEQSAYSYGTLERSHHWHSLRSSRRHYMEDPLSWELVQELRWRDVREYGPGYGAAFFGLVFATVLLLASRPRWVLLGAAGGFAGFGLLIPFSLFITRPVLPGIGAVLAAIALLGVILKWPLTPAPLPASQGEGES